MASFWYNGGLKEVMDGTIDIDSATLKVILVTSSYSANKDDDYVTASGAGSAEISVSGYTGGWGGSGRKTWASVTAVANDTNDRVDIGSSGDLTWSTLATGATIAAAILIKEGASDDTTSRLIAYWDVTDTPTNGGDITLDFTVPASGGNLQVST